MCVVGYMCVYHDASPQLSHSFPAASRGWKQVKPQTSGAPQPIRIVYLANHGRRAEQEHTASHTALHWKSLLSFSLSPSFSTPLNFFGSISSLASLHPLPSFSNFYYLPVRFSLLWCSRSPELIMAINMSEFLLYVFICLGMQSLLLALVLIFNPLYNI